MGVQGASLSASVPRSGLPDCQRALGEFLSDLMTTGGDNRLAIDPATGTNAYGCLPSPTDDTFAFSSSTASPISAQAHAHVSRALEEILSEGGNSIPANLLRDNVEYLREELAECLGLTGAKTQIVFSPSGTDAQLHALLLTKLHLGGPLTTITVGADQTGSGTAFTSKGQHFSTRTARDRIVEKGAPIAGLSEGICSVAVPLVNSAGGARVPSSVDAEIYALVEREVRSGRKVLLQAMDASKFGWRAPSDQCLEAIGQRWPDDVQVIIDACQLRIGRQRIAAYLARGYIILVTGSKFFTGPAFSGALLVPQNLFAQAADMTASGLEDYATQSDYPPSLAGFRSCLDATANLGQWVRWKAAVQEMRAYYTLPLVYRQATLARLAKEIPGLIAGSAHLESLMPPAAISPSLFDDEEMSAPTIFPFLMRPRGRLLNPEEAARVYRALMAKLPAGLAAAERRITDSACLIGQPVKLPSPDGEPTAALRICMGARTLSQAWSAGHKNVRDCVENVVERVRIILLKTDLIVGHLDEMPTLDTTGSAA